MIVTLVKRVSRVLLATHSGGGSQPKCDVYVEIGPDLERRARTLREMVSRCWPACTKSPTTAIVTTIMHHPISVSLRENLTCNARLSRQAREGRTAREETSSNWLAPRRPSPPIAEKSLERRGKWQPNPS